MLSCQKNLQMWLNPKECFKKNKCMMGNGAFENHWFAASAFTALPGQSVEPDHAVFDGALSKARVMSDHTIGLLRGTFPWLQSMRKTIAEDVSTLTNTLLFMKALET